MTYIVQIKKLHQPLQRMLNFMTSEMTYNSKKEITPTFATFVEELIIFFSHRIFKNHAFIG